MESKGSVSLTDKVGASQDAVPIDDSLRKVERRLRTKIDFFVVPTVTLLYLLCFIDRTNIGEQHTDDNGCRQRTPRRLRERSQACGLRLQHCSICFLHIVHCV
jgi:hypothetical protein